VDIKSSVAQMKPLREAVYRRDGKAFQNLCSRAVSHTTSKGHVISGSQRRQKSARSLKKSLVYGIELLSQLSLLNGILRLRHAIQTLTIRVAESLNGSSQLKQANLCELARVVSIGGATLLIYYYQSSFRLYKSFSLST
jgi:hypothetical protein